MIAETVEGDILCIGGGVAGLMAAIRASEMGAKVIVIEKGDTLRSGSGSAGNDHFMCYIPEFHGNDVKPILKEAWRRPIFRLGNPELVNTWLEKSFDIVKLWDGWGIPMKYQGNYNYCCSGGGGAMPMGGEMRKHRLKAGKVKADQIRETGAKIVFVPCHNCIDQIRDLSKEYDLGIKAVHFKEVITELMEIPEEMIPKEDEEE